jgi:flagellar biosynthetic protein FliQ
VSEQFVVHLFREAFATALMVSAPVLLVSMFVGLLISVVQAATSVQEFTLTFVPKVVAVAIVTVLALPWMMDVMVSFAAGLINQIPMLAH